ncbi:hypothetical protein NDU88_000035 [Pleurodeles waltl]|uniref:Uncharacterized protein n=1 Tax=Pleurodeles waltl TaxID=8319 RepID=A0AAV7WIB1_PLEWA|nr:hypothetical protein NDU88_000035 [Pleurodeles waltl]
MHPSLGGHLTHPSLGGNLTHPSLGGHLTHPSLGGHLTHPSLGGTSRTRPWGAPHAPVPGREPHAPVPGGHLTHPSLGGTSRRAPAPAAPSYLSVRRKASRRFISRVLGAQWRRGSGARKQGPPCQCGAEPGPPCLCGKQRRASEAAMSVRGRRVNVNEGPQTGRDRSERSPPSAARTITLW